jgi:hypothetical protein
MIEAFGQLPGEPAHLEAVLPSPDVSFKDVA